jgi:hypothetical protein
LEKDRVHLKRYATVPIQESGGAGNGVGVIKNPLVIGERPGRTLPGTGNRKIEV